MTTSIAQPGLRHRALLFDSIEQQADVLAPVIEHALDTDQPVFAVLDTPCIDGLRDRLGSRRMSSERLAVLRPTEVYLHPARALTEFVQLIRTHTADGQRVTLIGEPAFESPLMDRPAWAHAESVLNAAVGELPVTIVCAYHRRDRPAEILASAARTHPEVYIDGKLCCSPGYLEPAEFMAAQQPELSVAPPGAPAMVLAGPHDLRHIRRLVARIGIDAGLTGGQVEDFVLAVGELATNSVEHGSDPRQVVVWAGADDVVCEVVNRGAFGDPFRGLIPPDPGQPRGRGVFMARQICDSVQLWTDETQVRVQARMSVTR